MTKPLCIYHGNCADGFGAAWAVRKALGDEVEFHPGVYGEPPPDVSGRDVIIVDFSYKRDVLLEMGENARSIVILDHHKSAAEDLAGFAEPRHSIRDCWQEAGCRDDHEPPYIRALFDMDRSGAGITWDYFHDTVRPPLIDTIEDRDLWRFELPDTRAIQAALFSFPYDFGIWDGLMADSSLPGELQKLVLGGEAIERKHHKDVAELVAVCKRRMIIGGYTVWAASLPYTLASDAGHMMADGGDFAACYWDTPGGRVFSLRSTDDGIDVSEIAKQYGGGGHRNASGFRVPFSELGQFETTQ